MGALGLIEALGLLVAVDLMRRDTLGSQMADEAEEANGANC